MEALTGAAPGVRGPDRTTRRNGYRGRRWQARAGTAEPGIPKLRQGSRFPGFLEPGRMAGKVLAAAIREGLCPGRPRPPGGPAGA